MEFRKVLALRGPNVWANFPVLEAWVDLGDLDRPCNEFPGFADRLMSWMPTMIEHRCSIGQRGGFFQRLRTGTYLGHILEHVTLELQTLAGTDVGFGKARETSEKGVYKVIIEYIEETVGRECLAVARELCLAAVFDRPFNVAAEIERLRNLAHEVCLGPSTRAIVEAVQARGIPYRRLNTDSLVLFGHGRKQRRIQAAETDRTGAIAEAIAQDKEMTRMLLRAVGVPTSYGRPVADADDAWLAACDIGVPVVVKPQDGNQGRGVATNLTTREQVLRAYDAARQESEHILVEKFAPGHDYRLAGRGRPGRGGRPPRAGPGVGRRHSHDRATGRAGERRSAPGRTPRHGAEQDQARRDCIGRAERSGLHARFGSTGRHDGLDPPQRQFEHGRHGHRRDRAGASGRGGQRRRCREDRRFGHRRNRRGGTRYFASFERTGRHHRRGQRRAGLRMHLEPSVGISRPVGEAIADLLFPRGETGRIPIVAVTGVNGKTTTTRFIAHVLRGTGKTVGHDLHGRHLS